MDRLGQYLYHARDAIFGSTPAVSDENSNQSWIPNPTYDPSVDDVLEVKQYFLETFKLPLELIEDVIDHAEYWPHTSSINSPTEAFRVRAGPGSENQLILRTPPVGFVPLKPWENTVTDNLDLNESSDTITDVGPELEGTGRYTWSLDSKPRIIHHDIPAQVQSRTNEVLKQWKINTSARGYPCRKIVFTIKSHDQGWGGIAAQKGTYDGSCTWFDVGLEKTIAFEQGMSEDGTNDFTSSLTSEFPTVCSTHTVLPLPPTPQSKGTEELDPQEFDHNLHPNDLCLQKNRTATKATARHVISWSADDNVQADPKEEDALEQKGRGKASLNGEFVRNLKIGDVVTVWAKARFGGWVNYVEDMKVDLYWAV